MRPFILDFAANEPTDAQRNIDSNKIFWQLEQLAFENEEKKSEESGSKSNSMFPHNVIIINDCGVHSDSNRHGTFLSENWEID